MQIDVFDLFERLQAGLLAPSDHVVHDELLDFRVAAQHAKRAGYSVLVGPRFDDVHIWHYYRYDARLKKRERIVFLHRDIYFSNYTQFHKKKQRHLEGINFRIETTTNKYIVLNKSING